MPLRLTVVIDSTPRHEHAARGLRAHRRLRDRCAGVAGRFDRLALLAAVRFRRLLCRAARHAGARPLADRSRRTPDARITRRYRDNTLILETHFETADGAVTVIDFMPPRGRNSDIVRLVRGDRGRVRMRTELILRFDYGRTIPWVSRLPDGTFRAIAGPDMVTLHTPVPLRGQGPDDDRRVRGRRRARRCRSSSRMGLASAAAGGDRSGSRRSTHGDVLDRLGGAQPSQGEWSEAVTRSLITLKALTYAPTGGIVAAPTTSLPEQLGGASNWDYRFCWLRDATLTLLALMNAGYYDEARAWRDWLLRAAAGAPSQLQIMYGLAGERRLTEFEVPWLPGYEGSQPVRIGNAAHGQLQLDVFGEVMDALHQARRGGLDSREEDWAFQRALLEHLDAVWNQPDEGIWEVRGGRAHFTYSKVMAWVALRPRHQGRRGIRPRRAGRHAGSAVREPIHDEVCTQGFDRAARQLRAVVRLEGARRQPAAAADRGLSAADGSARPRARSQRSSATCSSTASCSATTRPRATTGCRRAKARSSPAASGWPTPTC